jgi:hypothetical protein
MSIFREIKSVVDPDPDLDSDDDDKEVEGEEVEGDRLDDGDGQEE